MEAAGSQQKVHAHAIYEAALIDLESLMAT